MRIGGNFGRIKVHTFDIFRAGVYTVGYIGVGRTKKFADAGIVVLKIAAKSRRFLGFV